MSQSNESMFSHLTAQEQKEIKLAMSKMIEQRRAQEKEFIEARGKVTRALDEKIGVIAEELARPQRDQPRIVVLSFDKELVVKSYPAWEAEDALDGPDWNEGVVMEL